MPGVTIPPATRRYAITAPLKYLGQGAIKHEIEVSKEGIAASGADLEKCFFPVLSSGWISHFHWNDYYQTDEEFFYAIAGYLKGRWSRLSSRSR